MIRQRKLFLNALFLLFTLENYAFSESMPSLSEVFLDIPTEYMPIADSKTGKVYSREEKRKLITLVDQKNGYLEARGNDNTDIFGGAEIALFKTKTGSYLIGVHVDSNGDGTENIQILTEAGKKWTNVTASVLPKITSEMVDKEAQKKVPELKKKNVKISDCASGTYAYKLPRHGTTIEVSLQSDCNTAPNIVLWHLKFDGTKFR